MDLDAPYDPDPLQPGDRVRVRLSGEAEGIEVGRLTDGSLTVSLTWDQLGCMDGARGTVVKVRGSRRPYGVIFDDPCPETPAMHVVGDRVRRFRITRWLLARTELERLS